MPRYEFKCQDCNGTKTLVLNGAAYRLLAQAGHGLWYCPFCYKHRMLRVYSTFGLVIK